VRSRRRSEELSNPRLGDLPAFRDKLAKVRTTIELQESIKLDDRLAETIIEALRAGTAPMRGALLLLVGREDIVDCIRRELDLVFAGKSALRLLNGKVGMGKTLMLRVLQDYAFQQNFATSFVTLTPRECPLYDLRSVYQHIVKGIRVDQCRDESALEWILKSWADNVRRDVLSGANPPWSFWKLSLHFKQALTIYFSATSRHDFTLAQRALSLIHGDITTVRDAKQLGMPQLVTSDNALEMLGNLTRMIRELGVKGLVILLDEAEEIPSVSGGERRLQTYSNLEKLSNAASSTPYSYFVYATTPLFFKHLAECDPGSSLTRCQTVTSLQNLSASGFVGLALLIKGIYLQAYNWQGDQRTRDAKLRIVVSACLAAYKDRVTPRVIVRAVVEVLDLCYEDPQLSLEEIVAALVKNAEG